MEEKKCPFCNQKMELECEFMGEKVYQCSNCKSRVCFGNDSELKGRE